MKLHQTIAAWFGYQNIKTRKINDTLEQHLANILLDRRINWVIDVGANKG